MKIYCLLIKILRSSVFAPQTSGAAVLVCEPFYVKFMSFGDKGLGSYLCQIGAILSSGRQIQ